MQGPEYKVNVNSASFVICCPTVSWLQAPVQGEAQHQALEVYFPNISHLALSTFTPAMGATPSCFTKAP